MYNEKTGDRATIQSNPSILHWNTAYRFCRLECAKDALGWRTSPWKCRPAIPCISNALPRYSTSMIHDGSIESREGLPRQRNSHRQRRKERGAAREGEQRKETTKGDNGRRRAGLGEEGSAIELRCWDAKGQKSSSSRQGERLVKLHCHHKYWKDNTQAKMKKRTFPTSQNHCVIPELRSGWRCRGPPSSPELVAPPRALHKRLVVDESVALSPPIHQRCLEHTFDPNPQATNAPGTNPTHFPPTASH